MKKCDLHVHTIKGVSDSAFDFSMDVLKGYVHPANILNTDNQLLTC